MPRHELAFLLFDGFATLDAVGPADVFAAANVAAAEPQYRLRYLALASSVRASNGMSFEAEPLTEASARQRRTLFVPGADEGPLLAILDDPEFMRLADRAAASADRVCSVCSGAFVLASLGLLKGRRATTHWRGLDRLAAWGDAPTVERDALYVEDGRIWTSAGVTSGIDMALAIVERDLGRAVALAVARELVLFLVRPGGQTQFSAPLDLQEKAAAGDLRELGPWLEARLTERLSVAQMAEGMGMSERSFYRRCVRTFGETPFSVLQRLRLERARSLLEDPSVPIKTVASQAGFADAATLGRLFRDHFSITPNAYRQTFGGAPGTSGSYT